MDETLQWGNLFENKRLDSNIQMDEVEVASVEEELGSPMPLRMLPPQIASKEILDWVLKKVEEIQVCMGLSCEGYEEQFKALLEAIEAGRSTTMKSVVRKERELKGMQ